MKETLFSNLASLCDKLARTTRRNEKIELISDFLCGLEEEEIAPAVTQIIGIIFPEAERGSLEIGYSTLKQILERKEKQTTLLPVPLTILSVRMYFDEISASRGTGSRQKRQNLLESLLGEASPLEATYLVKMIFGEMQHGVSEGLMIEAIASAARIDPELVMRANMLLGDIGEVARLALIEGDSGLRRIDLQLFRPIKPMLAEMAYSIGEIFKEGKRWAFEYKFDGARIQIHKKNEETRIFSRRLSDVTLSLPEIVELSGKFKVGEAVFEGEVIAIKNGKPLPFQELMRRFRRIQEVEKVRKEIPVKLYLFDILYIEGTTTIDMPYEKRWNLLASICPALLAERKISQDVSDVEDFLNRALAKGHEGLMAKAMDSPYTPGKRGKKWFKIKPAETLDLVIVAADWGYGRRTGWLSNYYLGAIKEEGDFDIIGKTFKGLTDQGFKNITQRLLSLKISETKSTVYVRPEIVVEVAFTEIQRSPTYKSGFALRFARITRIREDKSHMDADTINRVKEVYEKQFKRKGQSGINPG
ncbi:DNA ligase [uncultured archaeon]|nr:DNA ligase [uncultured archaeon]